MLRFIFRILSDGKAKEVYKRIFFINSIFQHEWNTILKLLCKQIKSINLSLSHHFGLCKQASSPLSISGPEMEVVSQRVYKLRSQREDLQCINQCNSVKKNWKIYLSNNHPRDAIIVYKYYSDYWDRPWNLLDSAVQKKSQVKI